MSQILAFPNIFLSPENRVSPQTTAVKPPIVHTRRRNKVLSATAFTAASPPKLKTKTDRASSLYEVLRVKRNASQSEIKSAYRSMAKLYHPDAASSESDGLDFITIHDAYATLSDPAARAVYDLSIGALRRRRSEYSPEMGFYSTRRWETDQCW